MASRFHSALTPVVNLAKTAGSAEKVDNGDFTLLYVVFCFRNILHTELITTKQYDKVLCAFMVCCNELKIV